MEDRIKDLEKQIRFHNKKYFIDNAPIISDEEFDKLTEELKKLKPNSAVLYEITGEIGNIEHPTAMLSLDKKYTYEDIKKWVLDTGDTEYIIEPKYDGMAARYQNNTLSTRGNGYLGEDISDRLPYLKIIGELPHAPTESAYGEIVIPLQYFEKNLYPSYKNPRNAVVGIVKAKIIKPEGIKALRDHGVHFVLHDQGVKMHVSAADLLSEDKWQLILEEIFHSPYPLDGVVIKTTNPHIKERLGKTQHHARYEVAYKSPAERKKTIVLDIRNQVGRTGRITSVAIIAPVDLSGATVKNVTLHNYKYIETSGIDIGSEIEVCRSGEVIPFITQVIKSPLKRQYKAPKNCPACNHRLYENNKYLECRNTNCPAQLSQHIEYFFKTLQVEELGIKTIDKFIETLGLKSLSDFYELDKSKIAELEGFGTKSAEKITSNIAHTLQGNITESKLLQAIGIKEIGPATSSWIINKFGFDNLPTLSIEDIQSVKGIGPKKAEHFIKEIKEKWPIVEKLKSLGLKFKTKSTTGKSDTKLAGLSFAITGKKGQYSRQELISRITENGGEYKTAITHGLNYLIAGEDAGSKLEKASKVGAKVINEGEFIELLT